MVKDGKQFKAKNRKAGHDVRHLKAALSSMPKPVHPKKGIQGVPKNAPENEADSGAPPVEIQFAQKLASNDPVMRNRAVKKLKRWLEARSATDTEGTLSFNEIEMMRLWKGLHYCFWMSDKPLVQEELAESIGSMINSFGNNESAALLYASSFMVTLGREWVGIDRWRMDKFMMLVRRVLRHCFCFLAKFGWKEDLVTKWSEICEKQVVSANSLNQHMKKKKKKRRGNKQQNETSENGTANIQNGETTIDHSPAPSQRVGHRAALGFQLHFVDIYLEELAKIGGEDLPAETIQHLLTPFIAELARGDDERLSQHIEERIFHHLMRQSDVGIAYEEGDSDEEGEMDQDEDEENDVTEDDDVTGGDDEEDEEDMEMDESIKDPRAGKVDVVLPQLQPDYEKLADALFQAGSAKEVSKPKRDRLYRLTKQLKALATGVFPLAIELSDDEEEIPKKINVAKAAKKAAEEEFQRMVKLREERKKFKQAIKEKQKNGVAAPAEEQEVKVINDESESEEDESEEEVEAEEEKTPPKQEKKSKIPRDARGRKKGSARKVQQNSTNGQLPAVKADSPKKKEEVSQETTDSNSKQSTVSEPTTTESPKKKKKKEEKIAQKEKESPSAKTEETPKTKKEEKVNTTESFETPEKKKKKKKKSKDHSPNVPSSPLILSLTPEQKGQLKKLKEKENADDSFSTSTPTEKKKIKNKESDKVDSSLILNLSSEPSKQGKKKKKVDAGDEGEQVITLSQKSSKKRKNSEDDIADKGSKKKAFTPMQKLVSSELLTNSLPNKGGMKKKRINFSLMENKCSSLTDIDKSILDSPDIPFHADKKPKQGVLKKTGQVNSVNTTPTGGKADKQSVAYNTLLNGRSTFMKRRPFASDFF